MSTTALAHLPKEGPPDLLYLLFHGVGATAENMAPLALRLAHEYPQAAVICLDGPAPYDAVFDDGSGNAIGRQWFSIRLLNDANRAERVAAALTPFIATVRALQARYGIGWERTALAGFSQGAIMALEAVQAEPQLAGRVLAFSGRHVDAPAHAPADTTVHLFHGMADNVIPYRASVESAQCLVALGGDVTADVLPGLGHVLHADLIDKAIGQLRSFLPKKVWRQAMSEAPVIPRAASSDELGA
ncbi:MAG: esterase [Bacteriovorax sp.]|nr:esterase [Rhizobacter sp.]